VIEYRDAEGKARAAPRYCSRLVASRVMSSWTEEEHPAALAPSKATRTLIQLLFLLLPILSTDGSSQALRGRATMSRGVPPRPGG